MCIRDRYYRAFEIAKGVGDPYNIITIIITTQSLIAKEIIIMEIIIIMCIGLVSSKQVSGVVPDANERITHIVSNVLSAVYREKTRGGERSLNSMDSRIEELSLIHI